MKQIYDKLKHFTFNDIINIESNDRQYLSLKKLQININNINLFFVLIISNALVCYQLSGKGEDYWEEFSNYFSYKKINLDFVIEELIIFISQSKNNKRLLKVKINRLKKLKCFIFKFDGKWEYYYNNMLELNKEIAIMMNQKPNCKTIVFSIKIFSYGARNIFGFIKFPKEIFIPIDSRLQKIFKMYKGDYTNIDKFYIDLSNKLNIPLLHLDSILWNINV